MPASGSRCRQGHGRTGACSEVDQNQRQRCRDRGGGRVGGQPSGAVGLDGGGAIQKLSGGRGQISESLIIDSQRSLGDDDVWASPGELIEHIHLFEDPMYVALPFNHRLAQRPKLRLRDLADEPWMLCTTTTCPDARVFKRACHAAGFEPNIAFENDDYHAILGFVAAGVGIALIPDLAARAARDGLVIRSLGAGAPVRQVTAAVPAGYRAPAAEAMLEVLLEVGSDWERAGEAIVYA